MAIATILPAFLMSPVLSSQALAQAAPNEKWVTVVVATEPTDLDGCQSRRDFQGRVIKQNVVETLVQTDPKNNYTLKPRLATSWERVDDSTWRFKLRQGVKFHDGAPFDSKAVLSSIKRTVSQPYCSDKALLQGFTMEGTAVDDHTIEFKTSRPEPVLPLRLSGVSIVSPNTAPDKISLAPVGTGPFVFDKWTANWDSRQCVFFRDRMLEEDPVAREAIPPHRNLVASMIDHGYCFNGTYWDFPDAPGYGLYYRAEVYRKIRGWADFEPWLSRIQSFPESILDKALHEIPRAWIDTAHFDELTGLLDRLLQLSLIHI